MVTKTYIGDQLDCRLVIRRNCSLTWSQTKRAVCVIAIAPLSIAFLFALAGLWPIVPFAGLELLALWSCFYHLARRACECEVVTVSAGEIVVEKGSKRVERKWSLERDRVVIALEHSTGTWYPSRLLIRARTQVVEIGGFLVEEERAELAVELHQMVSQGAAIARPAAQ